MINVTADNVIRLLPPLVMSEDEAREMRRDPGAADEELPRSKPRRRLSAAVAPLRHFLQFKDFSREELRVPVRAHALRSRTSSRATSATRRWSTARWR